MLDLFEYFGRRIAIAAVCLISPMFGVIAAYAFVVFLLSNFGYLPTITIAGAAQLLLLWLSFYGYSLLVPADPNSRLHFLMVGTFTGFLVALSSHIVLFSAAGVLMINFVKLTDTLLSGHPIFAVLACAPFFGFLLYLAVRVDREEVGA